jgi:hypothetical protein
MAPKFKPGDRVAFLWEAMELRAGTVKHFHNGEKGIYSVEDDQKMGESTITRFLYESEMMHAEQESSR